MNLTFIIRQRIPRAIMGPASLAALTVLSLLGCDPASGDRVTVDHRMEFLADSMRNSPETSSATLVLYPPAWARIHRDSVCFTVENPRSDAKLYALDIVLRDPSNGDSLGSGWVTFSTFLQSRAVSCQSVFFVGGRKAWQAPVEMELTLKEYPGFAIMATRKLVVDPNFAQLDLHPFSVHFFPDRVGMEWLEQISVNSRDSSHYLRKLVSWTLLPKDPNGICYQDTVINIKYYSRDCAPCGSLEPDACLRICSAAMDSALAAGPLELQERNDCAWNENVQVDSAVLANEMDGYGTAFLYGKTRATLHPQPTLWEGQRWESRYAEGVGDYSFISVDSVTGQRIESRILAVK